MPAVWLQVRPVVVKAVQKLFRLPRISLGSEEGKHQLLHHLRFTIDYLRRTRLYEKVSQLTFLVS